ncbi:MAG: DUF3325 domain-containing protein [Zoogloeaceae bacterium]|jgi:hypothetical protein|nr:DUF3325 domain-containing protein [Zoogloeaceae bacterium]
MSLAFDLLILALALFGFCALSASMERHAKQVFGKLPPSEARKRYAIVGWVALVLALLPAIHAYGPSTGIAVWVGILAVSATGVALLLTYRPRSLHFTFSIALAGVLLTTLMGW